MHAVLDLQTDRAVTEEDETLEEGLVKTGAGGFLVHDGGTELRVVCARREMRGILEKREEGRDAPPTMTSCLTPKVRGIMHSGSV
jgi:hypothetical protein